MKKPRPVAWGVIRAGNRRLERVSVDKWSAMRYSEVWSKRITTVVPLYLHPPKPKRKRQKWATTEND